MALISLRDLGMVTPRPLFRNLTVSFGPGDRVGLVAGTLSAIAVDRTAAAGVFELSGQGVAFLAASVAFLVDIVLSVVVSLVTKPKPASELKGLVYSETPKEDLVDPDEAARPWFQRTIPLAIIAGVLVLILNIAF